MDADSKRLLTQQLIQHEGIKLSAYQDSLGYWTIGVGRLIDARRGGRISSAEAMMLLENDIAATLAELDAALPWWRSLDEVRQRVVADMWFNLEHRLLGFTQMLAALQAGHYDQAADAMRASLWAKQVGTRADRLETMMRTGVNP
jgi:lysozyme